MGPTYYDARDQAPVAGCGWGIHVQVDDFTGRRVGFGNWQGGLDDSPARYYSGAIQ